MSSETVLKEYIAMVGGRYDYVIVDCSPNLGQLTLNVLVAADEIISPVHAAYLPIKALSEEDAQKLDVLRQELDMKRLQYIRYVISGQTKVLNPSIKYKEIVKQLAEVDLHLRVIALKESVSPEETLAVYAAINELKALLVKKGTSGQLD